MSQAVLPLSAPDLSATVPLVVAQAPSPPLPADPGGQGEDFGKSSPLGFFVLVLFFVAVVFLIRSMNKHLKRLPASFDPPADGATDVPATEKGPDKPATP